MPRHETETSSLADALSVAYGEVEQLRDELQSWLDGMPENLQSSSKADTLQEAISALENIQEIEPPGAAFASTAQVTYMKLGRKPSRATRCQWASGILSACAAELNRIVEELETEDEDEIKVEEIEEIASGAADELREVAEQIEEQANELDGIEFPGMMG